MRLVARFFGGLDADFYSTLSVLVLVAAENDISETLCLLVSSLVVSFFLVVFEPYLYSGPLLLFDFVPFSFLDSIAI